MNNIEFIKHLVSFSGKCDASTVSEAVLDNILTENDLGRYSNSINDVSSKYDVLLRAAGVRNLLDNINDIVMMASDVEDGSIKVRREKFNMEALLSEVIQFLAENYYNGNEIAGDDVYDILVAELKVINPKNPLAKNGLAASDDSGRAKLNHALITGTQEKCSDMNEFEVWFNQRGYGKYVLNSKVDGAGAELQYVDGELSVAISRGDGYVGEDITLSARKWNNLPNKVSNFTGSIRGEFLLKESVFRSKYSDEMRNARNASAGIAKRLDGSGSEDLAFVAYDVLNSSGMAQFCTEFDKMMWLEKVGFEVPEWCLVEHLHEVAAFRDKIYNARKNTIDYGCDGIVVKKNEIDYEDLKRITPMTQCAVKFPLDTAITKLIDIEWSLSGTYLSPVGIVEPVELCETTVQRASLSNLSKMMELGIEIGKMVKIEKRGEIIPKITAVIE